MMVLLVCFSTSLKAQEKPDLTKEKTLYTVPYAHLDTQWRWTYITTIDEFIKNTIYQNISNFDNVPNNVFTFTGSSRFEMMKEYYPEGYEKVKQLIKDGRWKVGGSSVDENDANIPSPESLLRQILYGNRWFQREFGTESIDFMLPDCFGFQAFLPSVFAHAGLRGFSTQKLVWGLPFPIPFSVGYWEGPDGNGVLAALDGTSYVGGVKPRMDKNPYWLKRINKVGEKSGYYVDFRYFGVGDRGGAPRLNDVKNALGSKGEGSLFNVKLAGSDQIFRDLPPDAEKKMKKYSGDLLLKEHSAGSITSQAYMKRWNRKNEQLADAAERAATLAVWLGAMNYPSERIEEAWIRILASQMHDIMPGTSLPEAYDLSWNDEIIALNQFAMVLEEAARGVIKEMDTNVTGTPLVVYNPLSIAREDVVEATVQFPGDAPKSVQVFSPDGKQLATQVLKTDGNKATIIFLANVQPLSWTTFDVRAGKSVPSSLKVSNTSLENAYYKVTINKAGDVASIIDKANGNREMLAGPAQIHFQFNKPRKFPAWNMDWADQKRPPQEILGGPAKIRIVENGPVRVALEVTREGRNSIFAQQIRLTAGAPGKRVEFKDHIDWQGKECAVKAAFPLTVSNKHATYNMGLGTIERPTNCDKLYEMPHREWLDLTDANGKYGVSILEDCKFGSDKPNDNTLRLTLIYTPGVRVSFLDQHSQDWGRHDIIYALYGHTDDWRNGTEQQGRFLNQPLRAFQTAGHSGALGKAFSFASVSSEQIDIRAIKKAEDSDAMIVRLQEFHGKPANNVALTFAAPIANAWEVNGQERRIGSANFKGTELRIDVGTYGIKSYAVELKQTTTPVTPITSTPVSLAFDTDVVSSDQNRSDGDMDATGRTIPAEHFPETMTWKGVDFKLGSGTDGQNNAIACSGQTIQLPQGDFDRVVVLSAADKRRKADFVIGDKRVNTAIGGWTGFIGQYDNRLWDRKFPKIDYKCMGRVIGLTPGYIHREPVAWFSHHRHSPTKNDAYRFAYIFASEFDLKPGTSTLQLPNDSSIKVFAVSVARTGTVATRPAAPLYDDFADWKKDLKLRVQVPALTRGLTPIGMASVDRKAAWEALTMGAPKKDDCASAGNGARVRVLIQDNKYKPHNDAGMIENTFPRLNDGAVALHNDDVENCSWYDTEGRFVITLKKSTSIARINTYTWHKSNRAPQLFTLWGSNAKTMPDPFFSKGKDSGWTLLSWVDSRTKGPGGKHGSLVMAKDGGALGPYRHILWITPNVGEGSFFTEVDVIEAE